MKVNQSRYLDEFKFYHYLLDIINSHCDDSKKIHLIRFSIIKQFYEFNKLIKSRQVTVKIGGKIYHE